MKYKAMLIVLFAITATSCKVEYPLNELPNFEQQPVLSGFFSSKYGARIYLTRILGADARPQDAIVRGAKIYLTSGTADTILLYEDGQGIYLSDSIFGNTKEDYIVATKIDEFGDVYSDPLVVPDLPDKVLINCAKQDSDSLSLQFDVTLIDSDLNEYWYWFRFAGSQQPRFSELVHEQEYELCEAENLTSSNSFVFSASCARNQELSLSIRSSYFAGDTLPNDLTCEVVLLHPSFASHLMSIQDISDYEFLFREPAAPVSNINNGVGYVAALNIYDTTFLLN